MRHLLAALFVASLRDAGFVYARPGIYDPGLQVCDPFAIGRVVEEIGEPDAPSAGHADLLLQRLNASTPERLKTSTLHASTSQRPKAARLHRPIKKQ
jgi:hypothetical protein